MFPPPFQLQKSMFQPTSNIRLLILPNLFQPRSNPVPSNPPYPPWAGSALLGRTARCLEKSARRSTRSSPLFPEAANHCNCKISTCAVSQSNRFTTGCSLSAYVSICNVLLRRLSLFDRLVATFWQQKRPLKGLCDAQQCRPTCPKIGCSSLARHKRNAVASVW